VAFRDRLLATLRAAAPLFEEPGVMVIGSEVPNLLQPGVAATLVVSQDVDIGVPLHAHAGVKARIAHLAAFRPHIEEPSVLVPQEPDLIELNLVGIDAQAEIGDAYVVEDHVLPLLVFGALRLISAGDPVVIAGVSVPVPRIAGLVLEKLLTDRTGEKGDRDLLVALGLLMVASADDHRDLESEYLALDAESRHAVRSNLTVLALMDKRPDMPDPRPERGRIARVLRSLEALEMERS
jgi:hypothetical protein